MVGSISVITCSPSPRCCRSPAAADEPVLLRTCPSPSPCPSMPCSPELLFKGGSGQNEPLSLWVEIWDASILSLFPALTMSICCCLFFRDYGSSKRKSGKILTFLLYDYRGNWIVFFPSFLNLPLCCMKLYSSLTFHC